MCHFLFGLSGYDFLDHHFGELLTVTVQAAVTLAATLFEHEHLVTLYEGLQHFTLDFCAIYGGGADGYIAVYVKQQYFVKVYGIALLHVAEMMNIQELAFFGLELLSFDFYDCVHR